MEKAEIARLTAKEAKARLDQADPFIPVDVRKESVYARGHIPGALCIPISNLDARLAELPAGKLFIFY